MTYLERNLSNVKTAELVHDAIRHRNPFLLTRYGDGELNFLKFPQNQIQHWLNLGLRRQGVLSKNKRENDRHIRIFTEMLVQTFNMSDVVGISSKYLNPVYKANDGTQNILKWNISVEELVANNINIQNKHICDHRIHLSKEIGMTENFKDLICGRDIHIIGYYIKYLIENKLDNRLGVKISYTQSQKHFYKNRKRIINSLSSIKEDIVLLGIGGIGMNVGCELKQKYGKIVIDVGSLLDAWAGVYTRPWFKPNGENRYVVFSKKENKDEKVQ